MKIFFIFLIAAISASAQPDSPRSLGEAGTTMTLKAQVLNMTASEEGVAVTGQKVLIKRHFFGKAPESASDFQDEKISDGDGRIVFSDLPYHHHGYFVLYTIHQGVEYTSRPIFSEDGKTLSPVALTIYDVKEGIAKLHIHLRHIVLTKTKDSILVSDAMMVVNPARYALIAPEGEVSFKMSLPQGIGNFAAHSGLPDNVKTEGNVILASMPINPGSFEVDITYTLPLAREIIFPIDHPTQAIGIFTEEGNLNLFSEQLGEPQTMEVEGAPYIRLDGGPFDAGALLKVGLGKSRAPVAILKISAIALASFAVIGGIFLIIFVVRSRSRKRAKEDSPQIDTAPARGFAARQTRKDAVISAIAELDECYGRGEISKEDYEDRRKVLKEEILKLLQSGE